MHATKTKFKWANWVMVISVLSLKSFRAAYFPGNRCLHLKAWLTGQPLLPKNILMCR